MNRPRRIRTLLALVGLMTALALWLAPPAEGQQLGEGMVRSGTVGIQNDTERALFSSLICMCGCPREALSTCTCGYAHERRDELRAELEQGKSLDEIRAGYVDRFGSAALSVPPNTGSQRLLFILPLAAIAAGAGGLALFMRRMRQRGRDRDAAAPAPPKKGSKRDDYDDKLDDELKQLDDDE